MAGKSRGTKLAPMEQTLGLRFPVPLCAVGSCIRPIRTHSNFYGTSNYGGQTWQRHRLSYHLNVHELPRTLPEGKKSLTGLVLHTCDNKWCVNPTHLYIGTKKQNQQDMGSRNAVFKETRRKQMLGNTLMIGRSISEATRKKISNTLTGRKKNVSAEGKARITAAIIASNKRRGKKIRSVQNG